MLSFTSESRVHDVAECPACSGKVVATVRVPGRIVAGNCQSCGGLVGHAESFYDTLAMVSSAMLEGQPTGKTCYFDFTFPVHAAFPKGDMARRHGFYEVKTRLVTQVG